MPPSPGPGSPTHGHAEQWVRSSLVHFSAKGCTSEGKKNQTSVQQKRTFTGTLSAPWSWGLLYFKGWRLAVGGWRLAVGSWWFVGVGGWRLVAVGGWQLVVSGGWWLGVGVPAAVLKGGL